MPDIVPVPVPNLPEKPSDFDGWSAEEVSAWLTNAIPALTHLERFTEEGRRGVGLALWKLRNDLSDGAYGPEVARLAEATGVSVSSLRRWRDAAEEHYALGTPAKAAKRSAAAKEREKTKHSARVSTVVEASAEQVLNADLLVGLDPSPPSTPVASSPPTAPDPAPGGNGAAAQSGGPPAEPGGGVASTPQEPSAQPISGNEPLRVTPSAFPEASSPGELVAALLLLKPDRLAGVDGPSLRSLLALVRGALEAQAARSKPAAVPGVAACPHPKAKRKSFGYVTICEACGQKV